jgi:hypothetical protein
MQWKSSMRRAEMFKSIKQLLVAATAILVLSAPCAAFARAAADGGGSASPAWAALAAPVSPATQSSSQGFHWGDAGIGAAGVVVLLSVGLAAAGVLRHRRVHGPVGS